MLLDDMKYFFKINHFSPWCKEESVSLLEGHSGAELRLLVVVAQMCDLIQVAGRGQFEFGAKKKTSTYSNSLVSEFGGDEEESCLEDVHGGGHGGRVEVLELDLCHLEKGRALNYLVELLHVSFHF